MSKKELTFHSEWTIEVRDKNGKLLERKKFKSHSWLKQFICIMKGEFATRYGDAGATANVTVVDETGASTTYPRHISTSAATYYMNQSTLGDVGTVDHGIIVGSDDTPNGLTTYKLGSKIGHGAGSGQLNYGAESVADPTNPSGLIWEFNIIRTFTNTSGATVTVKEIGLLIKKYDATAAAKSYLIVRDVLASPSSIPHNATMTVIYTPKITIS